MNQVNQYKNQSPHSPPMINPSIGMDRDQSQNNEEKSSRIVKTTGCFDLPDLPYFFLQRQNILKIENLNSLLKERKQRKNCETLFTSNLHISNLIIPFRKITESHIQ